MIFVDSFVAFLDVLGFKKMLEKDEGKIRAFFSLQKVSAEPFKKSSNASLKEIIEENSVVLPERPEYEIDRMSMSDAIVLRIEAGDGSQRINRLAALLDHVSILQTNLAKEDIWIRGGVAFGTLALDRENNFVAGTALARAYELESKYAKYCRVILDNNLIDILGFANASFLTDSVNKANNSKRRIIEPGLSRIPSSFPVNDLPLIVDFLSETLKRSDSEILEKVVRNLGMNLRTCPLDAYDKYRWVREYLLCCCMDATYCPDPGFLSNLANHDIPSFC